MYFSNATETSFNGKVNIINKEDKNLTPTNAKVTDNQSLGKEP